MIFDSTLTRAQGKKGTVKNLEILTLLCLRLETPVIVNKQVNQLY